MCFFFYILCNTKAFENPQENNCEPHLTSNERCSSNKGHNNGAHKRHGISSGVIVVYKNKTNPRTRMHCERMSPTLVND